MQNGRFLSLLLSFWLAGPGVLFAEEKTSSTKNEAQANLAAEVNSLERIEVMGRPEVVGQIPSCQFCWLKDSLITGEGYMCAAREPIYQRLWGSGNYASCEQQYVDRIRASIFEELDNPEIASFFTDASLRTQFAQRLQERLLKQAFQAGISPNSLKKALSIGADESIRFMLTTVLSQQKIAPAKERANLWVKKIREPLLRCLRKAPTVSQAQTCIQEERENLRANIAMAVVYELLRGELPLDLVRKHLEHYKMCALERKSGTIDCGYKSARAAIAEHAMSEFEKTELRLTGVQSFPIAKSLKANFEACLSQAFSRNSFRDCVANQLTIPGGRQLTEWSLMRSPRLVEAAGHRLQQISAMAGSEFVTCVEGQKQTFYSGARDPIDFSICETMVARRVVIDLVESELNQLVLVLNSEESARRLRDSLVNGFKTRVHQLKNRQSIENEVEHFRRSTIKEFAPRIVGKLMEENGIVSVSARQKVLGIDRELEKCLRKQSTNIDLCARDHALAVAAFLGPLKLKYDLGEQLGSARMRQKRQEIDALVSAYLSGLRSVPAGRAMRSALRDVIEKMKTSAQDLIFAEVTRLLMPTQAASRSQDLQKLVYDFRHFMPLIRTQDPVDDQWRIPRVGGVDRLSALIEGLYVYDAKTALDMTGQVARVATSLPVQSSDSQKRDAIVTAMQSSGLIEQIIKSSARLEVEQALRSARPEHKPAARDLSRLLRHQVFANALDAKMRSAIASSIAGEIRSKGLTTSEILKVRYSIALALVKSESFGTAYAVGVIQNRLNQQPAAAKVLGSMFLGMQTYDFKMVQNTRLGRQAVDYFKNQILLPVFLARLKGRAPPQLEAKIGVLEGLVKQALAQNLSQRRRS